MARKCYRQRGAISIGRRKAGASLHIVSESAAAAHLSLCIGGVGGARGASQSMTGNGGGRNSNNRRLRHRSGVSVLILWRARISTWAGI